MHFSLLRLFICWALVATSVIPATQEAEIRRISIRSQPRQIVHKILSRKTPSQKRTGGVAEGVGPEFKPQYHKKKKKKKNSFEGWWNGSSGRVLA
jgi:hypothetical protein